MAKRLITEQEVRAAPEGSSLRLAPGSIVTPAARDLASLRRVRLEETGSESSAHAAQSPSRIRDGESVDLPDGDWLLEVREGRARLRRIDDRPR